MAREREREQGAAAMASGDIETSMSLFANQNGCSLAARGSAICDKSRKETESNMRSVGASKHTRSKSNNNDDGDNKKEGEKVE